MQTPLLWLDGVAIIVDKIIAVDFTDAEAGRENREVRIALLDNSILTVKDPDGIAILISTFVPQGVQFKYKGRITTMKNVLEN